MPSSSISIEVMVHASMVHYAKMENRKFKKEYLSVLSVKLLPKKFSMFLGIFYFCIFN